MASAYTASQLDKYLEHIQMPARYRHEAGPTLDLDFLTALHIHQISAVPYENLQLHYSSSHAVSLDPQDLYRKIVGNARGRGGYCMENSLFFNHVLRALGFRVYTAGVRIRMRENGVPKGDYIGFVHIVNIVTLPDGTKYMIDVGFGGDQATRPLALSVDKPQKNLGSQEIRLIRGTISTQTDPSQQLWIYQYRNQREHEWNSFYAFGEFEFLPADWHMLNYFVSTNIGPTNIQVARLLVVRFLREGSEIVGKLMCVDKEVKRNMGGKTTIECEFANEQERVEGLKRIFGITLTDEEVEGIKGSIVELIAVK